jgi:hypothetical protein
MGVPELLRNAENLRLWDVTKGRPGSGCHFPPSALSGHRRIRSLAMCRRPQLPRGGYERLSYTDAIAQLFGRPDRDKSAVSGLCGLHVQRHAGVFLVGAETRTQIRLQWNAKATHRKQSPEAKYKLPSALESFVTLCELPDCRRKAVASYFAMMHDHFREARRVLRSGGTYVLVIGNSHLLRVLQRLQKSPR